MNGYQHLKCSIYINVSTLVNLFQGVIYTVRDVFSSIMFLLPPSHKKGSAGTPAYLTIILPARVGYEMIDSQRGA